MSLYLLSLMHILACCWLYIGLNATDSWIDQSTPEYIPEGVSNLHLYLFSLYWVTATLTTVGYGDIRGYSEGEYIFTMAVEFIGIGVFSFIMGSINTVFIAHDSSADIIEKKIENIEVWAMRLDNANPQKILPADLYDKIQKYIEASLLLDFNFIVEDYPFFEQLKPRLKHKVVTELFSSFKRTFKYLFQGEGFRAGEEFVSGFLSNLYCRIYIPNQWIIRHKENFNELYLVYKGTVTISLKRARENEFFVLPTNSMFGDYQIIMRLRSTEAYISSETDDTYTMCLKKRVFKQLLEKFPDAAEYYNKRAKERRIEMRRIKKLFIKEFDVKQSDDEEDGLPVVTKTYPSSNLPEHLAKPEHYMLRHDPRVVEDELDDLSDDEAIQARDDEIKERSNLKAEKNI